MARRNQQTFAKREREHKRLEKAARKRARRAAGEDASAPSGPRPPVADDREDAADGDGTPDETERDAPSDG